ncbi:Crp/Fnr family transcriptional regulator [Rhizobium laguerreae]|uniref:Crp/Fnr family transcriptional regulator n=1 Tax=Rhizobium laguerreae TaxID=1076926 RepID=UPI001C90A330|nr:Crp/Fnr family transcriptional regulator [Rhizobium laguerreae]MBY3258866.1 Crp/Fnr family transcriptional regulator [Rhizobium laguerreae]MBY3281993.1 Crp/Fnr family transcriptional regulator [Rhizobium laguerreae]MBY3293283.1 Crp/Fnr family transcriptional regulator [Rhizobium laguerreae]
MTTFEQSKIYNTLLRTVSPQSFARLVDEMERVDLPVRYVLVKDGVAPEYIYFIESGLGSVVATSSDGESIEVGHVGREGASGMHVMLAVPATPGRTFMQVSGSGIRVPIGVFTDAVASDAETRDFFLRYVHTTVLQLAHSALANARYSMQERLARWILMCHDRLDGDDLPVTHEFLSLMLGVRRSGVTDQLHILEGRHAVRSTRGNLRVLSRQKLLDIAGGCYGVPEREYEKVLGLPLRMK